MGCNNSKTARIESTSLRSSPEERTTTATPTTGETVVVNVNNKEEALTAMEYFGASTVLKHLSPELRHDKEIVLAAVQNDGLSLGYLIMNMSSFSFRCDKEIVMAAVTQNGLALAFVPTNLFVEPSDRKDIVMAAVAQNGLALRHAFYFYDCSNYNNNNNKNMMTDADKEDIAMTAATQNGLALEFAPKHFKQNKKIVQCAVQNNGLALQFAHDDCQKDEDIVSVAVKSNARALLFANPELLLQQQGKRGDDIVILALLSTNDEDRLAAMEFAVTVIDVESFFLRYRLPEGDKVTKAVRSNKVLIMAVVAKNGSLLEFAADHLKGDEEVVAAAVNKTPSALKHASEELKNNKQIVLSAVETKGHVIEYAPTELRDDKEIVLAALRGEYTDARWVLKWSSERLRGDKTVVLAALIRDGMALEYASKDLQGDKGVVLAAVKKTPFAIGYASHHLKKNDKDIIIAAIKDNPSIHELVLQDVSEDIRADKEVFMAAVSTCGLSLKYASESIKDDKEVVITAVCQDGFALRFASNALQDDAAVVCHAVSNKGQALMYASARQKSNKDIVIAAIQATTTDHRWILRFASEDLQADRAVVMEAVKNDGLSLDSASEKLRADKEVVLAAVQQNGWALTYACDWLKRHDKDVIMSALNDLSVNHENILKYASASLQADKEVTTLVANQIKRKAAMEKAKELLSQRPDMLLSLVGIPDRKLWLKEITAGSKQGIEFAEKLWNDMNFASAAIILDATNLMYSSSDIRGNEAIVRAAISQNYKCLQYASDDLKADIDLVLKAASKASRNSDSLPPEAVSDTQKHDKEFMRSLVGVDGLALRMASADIQGDEEVVTVAAVNNPLSLEYASDGLRANKEFMLKMINRTGKVFPFAHSTLKADKDVALAAIRKNSLASIDLVPDELKANRDFILSAVAIDGLALRVASDELRADEHVVMAAASQNTRALEFASVELLADIEFMYDMVTMDGNALEYAHEDIRANKEIVLVAVEEEPDALKFALGGLNQDRDCWIAAGLQNEDQYKEQQFFRRNVAAAVRVPLSTRFSLQQESNSQATLFTKLLNENIFFEDGNFSIYSPNFFNKSTCDPEWTRMSWPCRGTYDTCQVTDESLKTGEPCSDSCWRYSYRWHLEEAKRTMGFMIQIVDINAENQQHELGDGQNIETVMAHEVGTKIFRIYVPIVKSGSSTIRYREFEEADIDLLVSNIKAWHKGKFLDMSDCEIRIENRRLYSD